MLKNKIKSHLVDDMSLPGEVIFDEPRISIVGGRLYLENHKGIIEYTTDKLRVRTKRGMITVKGSDMVLKSIGGDDIFIKGKITGLEFGEAL
ncbi:MAG: sporulation protein YqfC [Christensenellales bacterium]|jgi:sporulation protein YqfC